ncbi:MAG: anaerobic ribonucleoside-triphosphate reductase [Promethearchaeia archaeon]
MKMEADKISQILEVHLKTLGPPLRRKILRNLYLSNGILSFSSLEKKVLNPKESKNLSFHLKKLKKCNLITTLSDGYKITNLGIQMYEYIRSMEDLLNERNKTLMIRTSKYSKEQFDLNKIESYLITEGKMEPFQAKKIANTVKQRLSKTNIKYLTAPLMREYINAILIEQNLEDVRHRLTRLGTPPYDVGKLFNNHKISPNAFIRRLGSDVSEQYLLLNILPKNLADLYLSGKIFLLNLNQWYLKPRGLFISGTDLAKIAKREQLFSNACLSLHEKFVKFVKFHNSLNQLCQFFTGDIFLDKYNHHILYPLYQQVNQQEIYDFLSDVAEIFNQNVANMGRCSGILTFEFEYSDNLEKDQEDITTYAPYDFHFCSQLNNDVFQTKEGKEAFHFLLDYNIFRMDKDLLNQFRPGENTIFYNSKKPLLPNKDLVNLIALQDVHDIYTSRIILDKIFINLQPIAQEANADDAAFFHLLNKRLDDIFQFFKHKRVIIKKRLNNFTPRIKFIENVLGSRRDKWVEDALNSISFLNLNEAVKTHCGIELDRVSASKDFALKLISFMQNVISEKNNEENSNYILSAPHKLNGPSRFPTKFGADGSVADIIRKGSTLSLNKKLDLYNKFQNIIKGGCGYPLQFSPSYDKFQELMTPLLESEVDVFYFLKK